MSKSRPKGSSPEPDDDREGEGRDVEIPHPRCFPPGVHRFSKLLAELIARRAREERREPPPAGDDGKK